jgi:5'-nucleotidase
MDDLETANVVQKWVAIASEGFAKDGFQAQEVITETNISLDGLEASVRNRPTELTKIVANGMLHETPGTELAIFNSGSIRIDDIIPPGKITQYDVIRIIPFGDKIINVEMNGALLKRVLDQAQKNKGMGGYLQTTPNVSLDATNKIWLLNDQPIYSGQTYKVALNEFLLTGQERGLDYLTTSNPNLRVVSESIDVRKALINELKRAFGPQN